MNHTAFTIVTPIIREQVSELAELLDAIGDDINNNPHLRFEKLNRLHYASFVIIDNDDPYLLFEGNIDGSRDAFLEQLTTIAGDGVDKIYAHCAAYPAQGSKNTSAVKQYLSSHDIGSDTFHVAWHNRSVQEIKRENELRTKLGEVLDREFASADSADRTPVQIRERLQEFVRNDPSLAWATNALPPPFRVKYGRRLVTTAALTAILFLVITAAKALGCRRTKRTSTFFARAFLTAATSLVAGVACGIRKAEKADDRRDTKRDPQWQTVYARWSENLKGVVQREDVQGQNHLTSVCEIKPGKFRLVTLTVVLRVLNFAARFAANQGSLGGITTIHFARWVMTDDRKHLIFLSNFDGSWERYLNDFIDLAAKGLTAVWTNTDSELGFPHTRWLLSEGARDEQRFKAYARFSQVRTRTWYCAYPDLTVVNIGNNMIVRNQLFQNLNDDQISDWLRRM